MQLPMHLPYKPIIFWITILCHIFLYTLYFQWLEHALYPSPLCAASKGQHWVVVLAIIIYVKHLLQCYYDYVARQQEKPILPSRKNFKRQKKHTNFN